MSRVVVSLLIAVLVNALLFTAMHLMVRQDRVRLNQTEDLSIANFVRMEEPPPTPEARRAKAPPKPRPEEARRINELVDTLAPSVGGAGLAANFEFDFGTGPGTGAGGPAAVRMASDLIPIVRVPPTYPPAALMRRIEGYVDVLFTVTPTGAVAEPTVLSAEPQGMFEDATLAAVSRWRFQPEVRNGRPIAIPVRTRVTFELDQVVR